MTEAAPPLCLAPQPPRNPTGLALPKGSVDCHFHVFDTTTPLATPRSYTPRPETLAGWLRVADMFGIARGVLVQPSVYGVDNSVLLAALDTASDRLRGIVVIPPETAAPELRRLHDKGVRGVRINLRNKGGIGLDAVEMLAPRLREMGWHLQFQVGPDQVATVADLCAMHQIDGVIDHLAFMPLDTPAAALDALQAALATGRVWVKISAPYRLTDHDDRSGYRDVVAALAERRPDRLLWGSDWPHTELFSTMPEEHELVALSLEVVPKPLHEQVFVQNPKTLYWSI